MADRHERPVEALQPAFQPFDGGDVQMIGRFIQQQHIGGLRQRPGNLGPSTLTARGGDRRSVEVNPQLIGNRIGIMPRRGVGAGQDKLTEGGKAVHAGFLFEQDHLCPRFAGPPPFVKLDQSGDDFQKRGFARPVATDQRQPVPLTHEQVEASEQPATSLNQADIFKGEERGCHRAADLAAPRGESRELRSWLVGFRWRLGFGGGGIGGPGRHGGSSSGHCHILGNLTRHVPRNRLQLRHVRPCHILKERPDFSSALASAPVALVEMGL